MVPTCAIDEFTVPVFGVDFVLTWSVGRSLSGYRYQDGVSSKPGQGHRDRGGRPSVSGWRRQDRGGVVGVRGGDVGTGVGSSVSGVGRCTSQSLFGVGLDGCREEVRGVPPCPLLSDERCSLLYPISVRPVYLSVPTFRVGVISGTPPERGDGVSGVTPHPKTRTGGKTPRDPGRSSSGRYSSPVLPLRH